jgi:hypothetical protein
LAIRCFLVVSAGAVLFPSCLHNDSKTSIPLRNLNMGLGDENLLAALTHTIIPKTTSPGASDVSAHLFVMKMVDDCYKKEEQQKFQEGLKQFSAFSDKQFQKPFAQLTNKQKEELLKRIEDKKDVSEEIIGFYRSTKRLTLQSFLSSEYYMTKIQNYKQAPGPVFRGCAVVKKA